MWLKNQLKHQAMKTIHFIYSCLSLGCYITTFSQEHIPGVMNPPSNPCGIYNKENIGNRRAIQYTSLREGDVMWEKRVWRDVDMREKQNQPLYFPLEFNPCRTSLFQALTRNILSGNIIAFADEDFMIPLEFGEVHKRLVKIDTVEQITYDPEGNEHITRVPVVDSTSINQRVLRYRLKEDWYFDRQKSSLEVRIVGIAAFEYDADKELFKELFWVYFPSCRPYFATNDVYNFKNDAERRSLDDIFWKRQFASVIVKESNVYDRYISQYQNGIDALLESDKIKMNLFNWEHDLWHY